MRQRTDPNFPIPDTCSVDGEDPLHEEIKPVIPPKPPAINRLLWLRFLTIAKPYWNSDKRWRLWSGLALLLVKPRYLLLDESTSALDAANESRLYSHLSGLGITPISVSHRQALLHHHHEVLVILGDSGWRMEKACEFKWDS